MDQRRRRDSGPAADGPSPEQYLGQLTGQLADLIAEAKAKLPDELLDEWLQRSEERLSAIDRRKHALARASWREQEIYRRLCVLAQWDGLDRAVQQPVPLAKALERLLRSLPIGRFVGECCARIEYIMNPGSEDEAFGRGLSSDTYSFDEVHDTICRLENRRMLVRYGMKASQLCFLVFRSPISAEFAQRILAHVRPEALKGTFGSTGSQTRLRGSSCGAEGTS